MATILEVLAIGGVVVLVEWLRRQKMYLTPHYRNGVTKGPKSYEYKGPDVG